MFFAIGKISFMNGELVLGILETSDVEMVLTSFDTFGIHGVSLCEVQWELVIVDESFKK